MTIAQFADAGKMTEAEYRARREAIRATYGDTAAERTGSFDQELARLFYQSDWSDEHLAKIEGRSPSWIEYRTRFGRFLNFDTPVSIPKSLTEGRFRSYWERTDHKEKNERIRFRDVARLMEEETTLSKPHRQKRAIGEALKLTSAGDAWHKLSTITVNVQTVVKEATEDDVRAVLKGIVQHGWYNLFGEKKKGAEVYRLVIGGKTKIDLATLKHELAPIIAGLKAEGRKNMATASPGTVAHLTFQLEQLLDKLGHLAPED